MVPLKSIFFVLSALYLFKSAQGTCVYPRPDKGCSSLPAVKIVFGASSVNLVPSNNGPIFYDESQPQPQPINNNYNPYYPPSESNSQYESQYNQAAVVKSDDGSIAASATGVQNQGQSSYSTA
ncbi:uncharacterized protein LOC108739615 [Agrilus planipennis]|uniref:Uncharacterized protein LOC108739615 n=1 Tax=Agrilus planipennis TaxID=224129 RepID=A0A1W4X9T6_AGRPL|nr:uncharacterized protein LOC108739615 [Agrilus planipennis]